MDGNKDYQLPWKLAKYEILLGDVCAIITIHVHRVLMTSMTCISQRRRKIKKRLNYIIGFLL